MIEIISSKELRRFCMERSIPFPEEPMKIGFRNGLVTYFVAKNNDGQYRIMQILNNEISCIRDPYKSRTAARTMAKKLAQRYNNHEIRTNQTTLSESSVSLAQAEQSRIDL